MFDNARRDKLPQSLCRDKHPPEPGHSEERTARNQALHRPHRDPAEHGSRFMDGVRQSFIGHLTPAALRRPTRSA
jgi:hypothetical protein